MLLAHLSDPHLATGPLSAEPASGLFAALGRMLALEPRPDCVLISGDLADHGRLDEYAALREILAGVPIPVHLMAGNHDDRVALLEAFAGTAYLGGSEQAHYSVDYPEATLVVLDSLEPGRGGGRLGAAQLAWLDQELSRRPGVPTFIGVHHPPIPIGIPFLDSIGLDDGSALAEVVRVHPQVVRVLSGHVHRPVTAAFAGTIMTTAPSTYRQSSLTILADRPIGYLIEPTGFLLHQLSDTGCVTHTVPVSHAAAQLGY